MIKAIFFDIDGTLCSFKTHQVSQSTIESLKTLKKNGIKIFVATGRGKSGLDVLKEIEFDGYITLNGQYCYNNNKVVYSNTIDKEDMVGLINYIKDHPVPVGFTTEDDRFYNFRNELVDELHEITQNDDDPAKDITGIENKDVYQIICFVDEKHQDKVLASMPHCIANRWYPTFFDISPVGGTKVKGIDIFLKHYNIDINETMSFGDGGNDIPMLKHTALSVAMGNGNDEVKSVCDYITDSVDDEGVTKALKHFNLI